MLIVSGYTILERLVDHARRAVFTAMRQSDGRPVILKLYRAFPNASHASSAASGERLGRTPERQVEWEFEMLARIASPHVPEPLEICSSGEGPVLVLQRLTGAPLAHHPKGSALATADFIEIAASAAQALADVHAAHVVHKNVKLDNLIVDREHGRVGLLGFGIAAQLGRAEQSLPVARAEGTLCSIAPEQTGRTARGIDFRTDLYSLGASLYELLTGGPLFSSERHSDLILSHLAVRPRDPAQLLSSIPLALSRVVSKLLEKDPELRYQTAHGLAADLELCRKQFEESREIDPELSLGSLDASDRLRFPSGLCGRQAETSALVAALERAASGTPQWLILSGPPGVGKSALANELREPLARSSGIFAAAKFDTDQSARPYTGIAAALASAVDQILTGSDASVARWRDRVREHIGALAGVAVEIVPNLALLIGDTPPSARLEAAEERARLTLALERCVRALAPRKRPMVLFLDDLQWADEGSASVLRSLATDSTAESLLIVAAHRDDPGSLAHPLVHWLDEHAASHDHIQTLPLAPLTPSDTEELLSRVLSPSPQPTTWLAELIGHKCGHSPLLMRGMLLHLRDRDLIRYEHPHGWVWDEREIREAEITDDAATMVAARSNALPAATRELLAAASCIGDVFDSHLLATIAGCELPEVLSRLLTSSQLGWISPCREGFKFLHDRIREAAKAWLSEEARAQLHLKIARALPRASDDEASAFGDEFRIAEHLAAASPHLDASERWPAIEVFHRSGQRSLRKGARDSAARYLALARSLLQDSDLEEHPERVFSIHLDLAEAAIQRTDYAAALELLDGLESRPRTHIEIGRVSALRIVVHSLRGEEGPIQQLLRAMAKLGVHWPAKPSRLRLRIEIARTDWQLRRRLHEHPGASNPPPDPSAAWLAPVLVVGAAAPRLSIYSAELTCIGWALALRSFCTHAPRLTPALVLAGYSSASIAVRGSPSSAAHYAELVQRRIQNARDPVEAMRAEMVLISLVLSWIRPRRGLIQSLLDIAARADELGDRQFESFSLHAAASIAVLSGEALPQTVQRLNRIVNERIGAQQETARTIGRAYELLQVGAAADSTWDAACLALGEHALRATTGEDVYAVIHVGAVLCLAGSYATAARVLERLWPKLMRIGSFGSRSADLYFYRGLAAAAGAATIEGVRETERDEPVQARRRRHRVLRQMLRKLRVLARFNPDFTHMVALLEAEVARSRQRTAKAHQRYLVASHAAHAVGYTQHAALAHERRADLLEERGRSTEARAARATAIELYRAWGALAKAEQLQRLQ